MIRVENIYKRFDTLEVLKGVSLQIDKGEVVSIVGASGAGKTTLLQIIGTLDKPDSGIIEIAGRDVTGMSERRLAAFRNKEIGFIFQFHQLLPEFTALENVMMPALIGNENFFEAERRAKDILARLNLSDRLYHKPSQMSGGERQRVAAARALINSPSVILADEPSGSLDSVNKKELHRLLLAMREDFGQTIVIVTHDSELAHISDRVVKMQDGIII